MLYENPSFLPSTFQLYHRLIPYSSVCDSIFSANGCWFNNFVNLVIMCKNSLAIAIHNICLYVNLYIGHIGNSIKLCLISNEDIHSCI